MSPECISAVSNVIVAGAAVTTAFFAWRGLSTWDRQMKGTVEYETARRLIRASYKLKDVFAYVRNPFARITEEEAMNKEEEKIRYVQDRFQEKWRVLSEVMEELEAEATEARVLWGSKVERCIEKIRKCNETLFKAMDDYINMIRKPDSMDSDARKQVRHTVHAHRGSTDQLSLDIAEALKELEEEVRPYLDRKL